MFSFCDIKKTTLLFIFFISLLEIVFLFRGNALVAQEACADTIYPLKTKGIITDCCIKIIKDENFVIYSKNGQNYAVEAAAIIKDGLYVSLSVPEKQPVHIQNPAVTPKKQDFSPYKYDYEKYAKRYRTGRIVATIGGFVSIAGIAMTFGSIVSSNNGNMNYNSAETLVIIGFFAFNFGVPTTIIGLAMAKNSKKAMIKTKQHSLDLSLGITKNGAGLVLHF